MDILSNMTYEDKSGLSSADQEERELRDAFRVFDKHNRGYITASDLRAVLQCLGEDLDEEDSKYKLFKFLWIVVSQLSVCVRRTVFCWQSR